MVTHIEIPNHRFERIACPVCGSGDQRLVISVLYGELKQKKGLDYSAVGIRSDTRLYVKECIECGFVFVNPRIKKEYEDIVYNECKKKMYEKKIRWHAIDYKYLRFWENHIFVSLLFIH